MMSKFEIKLSSLPMQIILSVNVMCTSLSCCKLNREFDTEIINGQNKAVLNYMYAVISIKQSVYEDPKAVLNFSV